ncbi:cellulase family glycosylhydrolase [Cellvibrio sp. pealriver]|uniref:cellulase family glycosylhydrolase n=1 Tax=Cellvibrio sp. pealriver TaxID=1622269 RepID=UPI001E33F00D|nr:cellulase family glycosylhydrolase [Cellvibrio sp. pealriver]
MNIQKLTIKKILLAACIGLSSTVSLISTANAQQSYLRADGQYIVNEQGEKVLLRGMGLGGWMLQEGYMLKLGNLGQQHVMRAKIEELIGAEATQEFYDAWLANHTTKADIDAMAKWGFNSVRLPMHFNLYTLPIEQEPVKGQNTWLEKGFEMTDQLVAWAKANNMYVILDLHAAPGGQGNDFAISDRNPNTPSLWQSEANQQKMVELWRKLAQRYANEPTIGAYDIINEPNWGFESADDKNGCKETKNEPLKKLMVDVTKAIRSVDNKHMIIIEGNCWGNNYAGVLPQWDNNMVLSFHKYWNNNTLGDIKSHLELREKYNMPIWLGESGENSNLWFTDAITLVESQGIGWAWWPLKKLGFNNPLEVKPNAGYLALVDYWNGKGEKPSAAVAKKALMQLANHDIRFENTQYHPEVIDAMFRQTYSKLNMPFKEHRIAKSGGNLAAVDYDMGHSGIAYFDKDSANYHISAGSERMPWNRGTTYRNEGVDIAWDDAKKAYFINHIETGEWTEYTIEADKAGSYTLTAQVKSTTDTGRIAVSVNNAPSASEAAIGQSDKWQSVAVGTITLLQGTNKIRIHAKAGGYELLSLQLKR